MFGNLTPMVKNLLLINVGVFLIQFILEVNLPQILGLRYIFSTEFEPYQIFAHIFVHADGWHLFSNMFALFIFGPLLERFWGSGKFLIFYLFTGLGASLLFSVINYFEIRQIEVDAQEYVANPGPDNFQSFITEHAEHLYSRNYNFIEQFHDNPQNQRLIEESISFVNSYYARMANIPMVGASGAVFGILMAFGYLFPNTTLMLLIPPIPIKAKYFVAFYGLYELYAGIQRMPGDNVAHFAHIGGMLFAFILIKIWQTKGSDFY